MRIGLLVLYVSAALEGRYAVAQDLIEHAGLDAACIDLNQTAMNLTAAGRLQDSEATLSAALANPASGAEPPCGWMILHNLATVMGLSGRLAEAEVLETRSLTILEKRYPTGDPLLLRPLQSLAQIQFQERKIAKARETFRRLQSIPAERPKDRAIVHGLAAMLLYTEGRYREGEAEYLKALGAWEESGRLETTDVAAVLGGLAALYIAAGRYRDSGQALDRALAIVASAKDAVATDWIKLFSTRAELHFRQREWGAAETDLAAAISAAARDRQLSRTFLESVLADYAYVLRKNHRRREARAIETRAAALQSSDLTKEVVDVSELLAKAGTAKK